MVEMKTYLMRVVCACVLSSFARQLPLRTTQKQILRLCCGLLLILTVMRPLYRMDWQNISVSIGKIVSDTTRMDAENHAYNARLAADIIKEKTESYIWDKALDDGFQAISITVEVNCDSAYPYASGVIITGPYTDPQKMTLGKWIEQTLAIPEDKQQWRWSKC